MGCCASSRRSGINRSPVYLNCSQRVECGPLSAASGAASLVSIGIFVDPTIDTSIPETYRAPSTLLPYDLGLSHCETLPVNFDSSANKTDHIQPKNVRTHLDSNSDSTFENSNSFEDSKTTDCESELENNESAKVIGDEPLRPSKCIPPAVEEEDVCPICLEEYDLENPCSVTKCYHHFHLSCILEWMERSHTCPICDQITVFENASEESQWS